MSSAALPKSLAASPILGRWLSFSVAGEVHLSPGKVEIGQGILSALAQIAADELDVAMERIKVLPADTRSSPNEEVTSGSLSIQDSGIAIRHASAEIRDLFLTAAETKLGVSRADLSIMDGVIQGPKNAQISYWELAADVSLDRQASTAPRLKPAHARSIVGTSAQRAEVAARVFGLRPYIHDFKVQGLRHGRVVRSPQHYGRIAEFNEAAFCALHPNTTLVRDGSFIGVVANSEWEAERAATALAKRITWIDGRDMPSPTSLHNWLKSAPHESAVVLEQGDCAVAQGAIQRSYFKPFIAHASIAPSIALAVWDGDHLTVTSHTQGVFNLQRDLALVFGLPDANVRVVHAEGAGCYGHNGADDVALDAALMARAVSAPVRVQWSRADELSQSPFGAAMRVDLAASLGPQGRIDHWSHDLYSNGHVARPGRSKTPALLAASSLDPPHPIFVAGDPPLASGGGAQRNSVPVYSLPNVIVRQHKVLDAPVRTSSLRSLGAYGNVFAIESFMDELALEARQDPLAFRLAHLKDERARVVLEKAAAMANWGNPATLGHGIAVARYKNTGAYCAVVAEVDVDQDPRATRLWIAVDVGEVINPDGVINQIEGSAIQSVSWTLKEQAVPTNEGTPPRSWADYPILAFAEVPEVSVEIVSRPDLPPFGAGECAQGPVAAALANALFATLGVRVRKLPMTRAQIIESMETR